ncbi:protein OSCP1-like [Palaemon carinicauda]|uniref:protein OSCP1-like n=1 Tax=Palaemon carinicauda TaxID=392227 RepID=UPI0035B5EF4B
MSLRALPLQFLNLGGEMMYIIDQRLRAQNIPSDKAAKVRNDIIGIMLNRRFVEELFKPQDLYCRSALRTVFDKLAHGSVMRLNAPSMDKLFDLMLMGLKYQVLMCPQPLDLLLVTLNHLDALKSYASSTSVLAQVEDTLNLLIKCVSVDFCRPYIPTPCPEGCSCDTFMSADDTDPYTLCPTCRGQWCDVDNKCAEWSASEWARRTIRSAGACSATSAAKISVDMSCAGGTQHEQSPMVISGIGTLSPWRKKLSQREGLLRSNVK